MNIRALGIAAIVSIINVSFPNLVRAKPETSTKTINLEVIAPQSTGESNSQAEEKNNQNERIEVNSEEVGSQGSQRLETFELDRTEGDCQTTETNRSVDRKTFEGYCDWDWKI